MRNNNKTLIITLSVLVGVVILSSCFFLMQMKRSQSIPCRREEDESILSATADDADLESQLFYRGKLYRKKPNITTVLLLGIDDTVLVANEGEIGNGGRADAILLLVIDTEKETIQILDISRDTMMEIDAYDHQNKLLYSGLMHLNMQYAFGDTPARSCYLMKNKISQLLYGIRIDYHFSMSIEGFSAAVDKMSGVTVTFPEDCTDVNPTYIKGAVVHMDGTEVENFVRFRDMEQSGGNTRRMQRHNWILSQIFNEMRETMSESWINELLETSAPFLNTDVDIDTMIKLKSYQLLESKIIAGESKAGKIHDEFYVDEEQLKALLVELFYLPEVSKGIPQQSAVE